MFVIKPHAGPIHALAFSPDGDFLVSSSGDATIKITDLKTRRTVRSLTGAKYCCPIAFSPDGKLLARGGTSLAVWEWSESKPTLVLNVNGVILESIAFSHDSNVLASQATNHPLKRWSIPSGSVLPAAWGGVRNSNRFPVGCLAYSTHEAVLATSFGVIDENHAVDSVVMLWDAVTGASLGQLRTAFAYAHPTALAFSPDGRLLAGIYGPTLCLFDVAERKLLHSLRPGPKYFKGMVFTPDGRKLVTVSKERAVRVWTLPTLAEERIHEWNDVKLTAITVSRDGTRMAAGSDTGHVIVWDAD